MYLILCKHQPQALYDFLNPSLRLFATSAVASLGYAASSWSYAFGLAVHLSVWVLLHYLKITCLMQSYLHYYFHYNTSNCLLFKLNDKWLLIKPFPVTDRFSFHIFWTLSLLDICHSEKRSSRTDVFTGLGRYMHFKINFENSMIKERSYGFQLSKICTSCSKQC